LSRRLQWPRKARSVPSFSAHSPGSEARQGQCVDCASRSLNGQIVVGASRRLNSQSVEFKVKFKHRSSRTVAMESVGPPAVRCVRRGIVVQFLRSSACAHAGGRLTLPSRGQPTAGFASCRPPLMSNVRAHEARGKRSIVEPFPRWRSVVVGAFVQRRNSRFGSVIREALLSCPRWRGPSVLRRPARCLQHAKAFVFPVGLGCPSFGGQRTVGAARTGACQRGRNIANRSSRC
jgi:hypothetical protein